MELSDTSSKKTQPTGTESIPEVLKTLSASALQVARGDFDSAKGIFDVTALSTCSTEVRDLAETMGLMCVNLEAREFRLEQTLTELRQEHEKLNQSYRLRAESGLFFSLIIVSLCLYIICFYWMMSAGFLGGNYKTILMIAVNLVILSFSLIFIHRHRYPWDDWGFTWKNSSRAMAEVILLGIPVILAGIFVKWYLTKQPGSIHYNQPVFETVSLLWTGSYLPISMLQEIITRGVIQTSIVRIIPLKASAFYAIVLSSLLFAITHLFYSAVTMAVTFFASLVLGWLFYRHKTLVGVITAHYILGLIFIFILKLIGW